MQQIQSNPLDTLETLFAENEWNFSRNNQYEISIEAEGGWGNRSINFIWQEKQSALYFTCRMNNPIQTNARKLIDPLLAKINAQLWMGHFELCPDSGKPTFRHCLPLRGMGNVSFEVIEDLLSTAISECERFYPAFQMVLWGNYNAEDAMQTALWDCQGSA